jgi:cytochrome c-type biogenesis protein CcmF
MGKYMVTYVNDYMNASDRKKYYQIDFKTKDGSEGFSLFPDLIKNNKGGEGFSANPDAKHYLYKDVFAYLTSVPKDGEKDTSTFQPKQIKIGDTAFYGSGRWVLNNVSWNPAGTKYKTGQGDSLMVMDITVIANSGSLFRTFPAVQLNQNNSKVIADSVVAEGLVFRFDSLLPDKNTFEIGVKESKALPDFVTLKVYEFPMIIVLWLGVIVMFFGFILSMYYRITQLKNLSLVKK